MPRTIAILLAVAVLSALAGPTRAARAEEEEVPVAVRGRVVDDQGQPMARVRVYAGLYEPGNTTHTAADGTFELRLRSPKIPLHIRVDGFLTLERTVPNGTLDLQVRLRVGARVRGRLVAPAGAKLPTSVRMLHPGAHARAHTADVAPDGSFASGGFPPGSSDRLGLWAPGFMPLQLGSMSFDLAKPLALGAVTLVRGRRATVHVRDHEGRPVAGARVRIQSTRWSAFSWDMTTAEAGDAVIAAAPADALRVEVRGPHTDSPAWLASLAAGTGKPMQTTVVIEHPVTLRGALAWQGEGPAPWAGERGIAVHVVVHDDPRTPRTWRGQTAGQGSAAFQIRGCVPGRWTQVEILVAVKQGWSRVRRALTIPRGAKPRSEFALGSVVVGPPSK